ncbi:MAG: thiolase C-terminal domain-containing protein [Streptosporangiales bacterium]
MRPGSVAIVGAAETDALGTLPGISAIELHAEAARNALADCKLSPRDIDGVATAGLSPIDIAHYLGVTPGWIDSTSIGGCSFMAHVRHAAAAITAGMASTVLVTHGQSGRSRVGEPRHGGSPAGLRGQFEAPYGVSGPPTMFTLPVLRYMKTYGLTHEQLASVAVAQRKWAHGNPRAKMRDLVTVADVLASRLIAYPFHLFECCLVTDGGGALVLMAADRAADVPTVPVFVLGTGEACEAPLVSQMEDATTSKAFRLSSAQAFGEAGIGPNDVDHLMIYDAFAHLPIYGLEDLGFVGRGEAGAFIADGNTEPGGSLPMNTNGGGLSYTHTGMYGMFAIQESVRQLRGQAVAQVPDVTVSFAQGIGGMFTAAASLVLANSLP